MQSIKKILYATDFSESSLPAAVSTLTLAKLSGAAVHVLHVIGEFADRRKSLVPQEAMTLLEREVEIHVVKEMEEFCQEQFSGKIPYTTEVVLGRPFEEILRKAEELSVDLIIVGTHGRTGLERVIVGSTAERLVRKSPVPVLTVRA